MEPSDLEVMKHFWITNRAFKHDQNLILVMSGSAGEALPPLTTYS